MSKAKGVLEKYLPPDSLDLVMPLLKSEPVELKIKSPRSTKFGDYRFPKKGERHKISVNNNLNSYAFLITLLHEIAHLKTFVQFGTKIKPHGKEWQNMFLEIAQPFIHQNIFPENLKKVLLKSLQKGNASSCTDLDLFRELQKFDEQTSLMVEDLPEGELFKAQNNMLFKKGPKARKRFRCLNIDNGKEYMVHPLAIAVPINKNVL